MIILVVARNVYMIYNLLIKVVTITITKTNVTIFLVTSTVIFKKTQKMWHFRKMFL